MIIRLTENINSVCGKYEALKGEEMFVFKYDDKLAIYHCNLRGTKEPRIVYEVCKECAEVVEQKPVVEKCEFVTYNNEKNRVQLTHSLDDMEPPKEWKIETKLAEQKPTEENEPPLKIKIIGIMPGMAHAGINLGDEFYPLIFKNGCYLVDAGSHVYGVPEEAAKVIETMPVDQKPEQETSTGGSSKYYDLIINGQPVKAEDVIKCVFDNDFDFGNAFKALVRAHAAKHGGGKAGSTVDYNCEKLKYYADRIKK